MAGPLLQAGARLKKARTSKFGGVAAEEPGGTSPI